MAGNGHWRFRPRLGATLVVLPVLAVLVGLGIWQMQRLEEKQALIADLTARQDLPPVDLPETIDDPAMLEFTPVRLHGHFLHERELYLDARVYNGEPGTHVVTPFVRETGGVVLVDRGWVPNARRAPESRAAGQVEGPVTLDGLARTGGWKGNNWFRPANRPAENAWLWMDLPAMAAQTGFDNAITSMYVAAGPAENPGGLPIGGLGQPEVRNPHLGYALTWFALAVALLVIYMVHQSRPSENMGDEDRGRL